MGIGLIVFVMFSFMFSAAMETQAKKDRDEAERYRRDHEMEQLREQIDELNERD